MKTLIIGCGYVGLPLALRAQARGDEVSAWVHSRASAEALEPQQFSRVIIGSVGEETLWKSVPAQDQVIHCASSSGGGVEAYREVFLEGARRMAAFQPGARKLMVSSTSVYGQQAGEIVTEESVAEPASETGKILRDAEEAALRGGVMVVRSAGIYGPGRAVLFEKLKRGEAVMEGDGSRWMNQIHLDDLVIAVELLLQRGTSGEIYNASDNEPVKHHDYYAWCSELLHVPLPPSGPVNAKRKRGVTNKRVANAKLRSVGWEPEYPDFRVGLRRIEAIFQARPASIGSG